MSAADLDVTTGFDPSSAADLAGLLDALPSMITYIDRHGVSRYANAAAARWLRCPADAVVGRHVRELLTEEGYRAVGGRIEAALRGERQDFVRVMPTDTGKVRYALTEYLPVTRDGHPDGFIAMATDITDRILAERGHVTEVVRSAELEQRNRDAVQASDDVLQQLYAVGLQLDRLTRHPQLLPGQVAPVLTTLQDTVDRLRYSITGVLLGGESSSTVAVLRQLVAGWATRTGTEPAVLAEDGVDDLPPHVARQALTALSQILATAARHDVGPFRIHVVAHEGEAIVTVDGEDWPGVARSEFGRMASVGRENGGGGMEVDTAHPVLTRVTWRFGSSLRD